MRFQDFNYESKEKEKEKKMIPSKYQAYLLRCEKKKKMKECGMTDVRIMTAIEGPPSITLATVKQSKVNVFDVAITTFMTAFYH